MLDNKKNPTPIDYILMEIEKALDGGFYYLAISTTLTLPDICGALISDNGASNTKRYEQWCADNLSEVFTNLTPNDLRSLRNGVSHTGRFGKENDQYSRAVFMLPKDGNVFADCLMNDVYLHSTDHFCRTMIQKVRGWYHVNKDHKNVKKNLDRMVRYRPDGFGSVVKGAPVIA